MDELTYETSHARLVEFKASGTPKGTALFSRYFSVDADNDYTKPGFLPHGSVVPLLIGHQWSQVPVGKGKIRSEADGGYFDFELANTRAGEELAAWLRHDMDSYNGPVSEWSYGFTPYVDAISRETIEGKSVRVLSSRPDGSPGARVHECSYVLKGSGVATALVDMKNADQYHWARRHRELSAVIAERKHEEQAGLRALYQRVEASIRERKR